MSVQQLLLPLVAGIVRSKQALMEWVHQVGLLALGEVFEHDVEQLAGPRGRHAQVRSHYRWGRTASELPFGGRRIVVERPRVRGVDGGEAQLPTLEEFRTLDAAPARVLNQILLGVSTRGYGPSLEPAPAGVKSRGTSKSAASRHLIGRMGERLGEQLSRRLDELELLVLMLDGVQIAHRTVVVALGILANGHKAVLGLWQGSTENAALCTALLHNLIERGLKVDGRLLCVIDGGKGLRKALADVFGDLAVVPRCRVHKQRNVLDHLPQNRKAYVARALSQAWAGGSAEVARRRLKTLLHWLERNGESGAAASLHEGLEETLTVAKLGLPPALRTFLVTTNAIENLMGSARRLSRNVTRWRPGDMISRWTAAGLLHAEQGFHRIKGYRHLSLLAQALHSQPSHLDQTVEAA